MQLNPHYAELNESYLFSTIAHKVADYQKANPDADIIRLGIGDVTLPLAASVTEAMHKAVEEQGHKGTFHGYIPSEQGYEFLRSAIQNYYTGHGVALDMAEIFISDGAKSDLGNLLDLFSQDNTILVPDPVYPVYVDDNVMAGRKILYLPATAENNFLPMPDEAPHADIVYICSPNNPTGATYSVEQLKSWVAWAKTNDAVILFDAAYECFVSEQGLARSIYEVEGAKEVAIEVCSFSKIAGFTGTRCGYTVVPTALANGKLNKMWLRRQTTKFNGVAYVVQRGAEAVFTEEGMEAMRKINLMFGIELDGTYTGKTLAALMDADRINVHKNMMFWNTLNSRPAPESVGTVDYHELPQAFHHYFEHDVQSLDKSLF